MLLHPVLMSADCADIRHEAFITAEKESYWATVPAICTNFKLTETTTYYLLKEHCATCTVRLQR